MSEAKIRINGTLLTEGQATTIRVALSGFYTDMSQENALGEDDHGRLMADLYRKQAASVLTIMSEAR